MSSKVGRVHWSVDTFARDVDGEDRERRILVGGHFLLRVVSRVGGSVHIVDFGGVVAAGVDGPGDHDAHVLFRSGRAVWRLSAESCGVLVLSEPYRRNGGGETLTRERCVVQDRNGQWVEEEIEVLSRRSVRVVSDVSPDRRHRRGRGEDLDLVVDDSARVWLRRDGSDGHLRREFDGGVSVAVISSSEFVDREK